MTAKADRLNQTRHRHRVLLPCFPSLPFAAFRLNLAALLDAAPRETQAAEVARQVSAARRANAAYAAAARALEMPAAGRLCRPRKIAGRDEP